MKQATTITTIVLTLITIFYAGEAKPQYIEHLVNRPIAMPNNSQMADMDNDGDNDIISVSREGEVVWYEYAATDTSFSVHYIETGGNMWENKVLSLGDLDSDGDLDILTLRNYPSSELYWYENDGSQNFSLNIIPSTLSTTTTKIVIVDIDDDGNTDIVANGGQVFHLIKNDSSQNFSETTLPAGGIRDFVITDFNTDGIKDLVFTTGTGVSVFYQDSSGAFGKVQVTSSGTHRGVDAQDIDGDADMDIVAEIACGSEYCLNFYYNQGNDTTFSSISSNVKTIIYFQLKDMDLDNDLDIVFHHTSNYNGTVSILRNDSTPDFDAQNLIKVANSDYTGIPSLDHVLAEDFNNDGYYDVITTSQNPGRINLHLNSGNIYTNLNFSTVEVSKSSGDIQDVSIGDFNGDNKFDVIGSSPFDKAFELMINSGNTNFHIDTLDLFINPGNIETVDLDGDGDMDIVACQNKIGGSYMWYENDGQASFTYHFLVQMTYAPYDVKVANLDNDGDIDIVAIADYEVRVLYNDGNQSFTSYNIPVSNSMYYSAAIYDIDGDSLKDILLWDNGQMAYCQNNGSGFYSPSALTLNNTVGQFGSPTSIEVGDIDNDGDPDIVFAAGNTNAAGVMENLGGLTFNRYNLYNTSALQGNDLKLADMDADADLDIVIAHGSGVSIAKNDTGNFSFQHLLPNWSRYENANTVQVVDFDSDGDLDIAYGTSGGDRVAWLENCPVTYSDTLASTACDSLISPSGNHTWYTTGIYSDTILNAMNCDSIITIDLTINNSTSGSETITACDSYTWSANSTTYTVGGTYTTILTNAAGCDSTATLNLTLNYSSTGTDIITACDSYTWIDGITYAGSNNTAKDTLVNAAGCDSIVSLDLTINYSSTSTDVITACDSYTWIDGNTYTSSNNTATDTLVNAAGCDSIVSLDLTINYSTTSTDIITACDSYTWIDGNTYTTSNSTAKDTLVSAAGCDSIVTLNLTINYSSTSTENITACDSYTWPANGNIYTTGGTHTTTLTSTAGCDSVVTLNLTIKKSVSQTATAEICQGDSIMIGGVWQTAAGEYTDIYTTPDGCDSTVATTLIVNPLPTVSISGLNAVYCSSEAAVTIYGNPEGGTFSGTGVTGITFDPAAAGVGMHTITYTYTDANGCTDEATQTVTVDNCTGIQKRASNPDVKLYPNPTHSAITVAVNSPSGGVKGEINLILYNSLGEKIYETIFTQQTEIDLASYASGVYFLQIDLGDGQVIKKVVKE